MGKNTKIEWARHTFNPWWGCQRVSMACDHCYAETLDKRVGGAHWGPHAERRLMSDKHWQEPLKWNEQAELAGERHRVFCASMADVMDNKAPAGQHERLWNLIAVTQNLDWLLLTKRPENWPKFLPIAEPRPPFTNIRLGVTIENQDAFDRRWPILEFAGEIAGDYLDPEKTVKGFSYFNDRWSVTWSEPDGHCDDEPDVCRIGKKSAGRKLDGIIHDGFPRERMQKGKNALRLNVSVMREG